MKGKVTSAEVLLGEACLLVIGLAWVGARGAFFAHDPGQPSPFSELLRQLSPQLKFVLLGIGLGLACVAFDSLVLGRLVPLPDWEENEFRRLSMPAIVVVAISSGLCEEVLFRGAMQPVWGLWLTSAVFGLGHFTSWQKVVNTATFGLVMGAAALYFGNLWVPIMAHMTNNFVQLCMMRDK